MSASSVPVRIDRPGAPAMIEPPVQGLLRIALFVIAGFFAIFILWGSLAPIDRAAIAPGELKVEGKRRVIQNLEGGILAEIAVKENEYVKAGQLLARLDATQTSAVTSAAQGERLALLAESARLAAELAGRATIDYPADLRDAQGKPRIAEILENQQTIFDSRAESLQSQRRVLEQRAAQARAEIGGLQSQIASQQSQLALLTEEMESVRELVEEQLERRPRLLAIQRQVAAVEGNLGELRASIARANQVIAQAQSEIRAMESVFTDETVARQRDIQMRLTELDEKLKSARDTDERRAIYAPVDGQVINFQNATAGAVVRPGDTIMEVVPESEQLVITAQLKPTDIDSVYPGLETTVHLVPYSGRTVPRLKGTVTSVADDTLVDPRTGRSYYTMTVHIGDQSALVDYDIRLVSGMPAEVFVKLGDRSLLGYFLQPIKDSFYRAFREA